MKIRFDRNEWSGAFGDLGTDLPLVLGVIWAAGLDPAKALACFGLLQLLTGLIYRMPMPVQPLKAMAAVVIAQNLPAATLRAGGLLIGVMVLALTLTGLLERAGKIVPAAAVRAVQLALGLQLAWLAATRFMPAEPWLAGFGLAVTAALLGNRRFPPAPILVAAGAAYAWLRPSAAVSTPLLSSAPTDWSAALWALALPQLALSLANSLLATQRTAADLFPEAKVTLRKLGLSYSAMNLAAPLLGGLPVCHGSGGMVGHHAFGARTGGSVVLEGLLYVALAAVPEAARLFPAPILGVILLIEGLSLARLALRTEDLPLTAGLGLAAVVLPYGYAVAVVAGALYASLKSDAPVVAPR